MKKAKVKKELFKLLRKHNVATLYVVNFYLFRQGINLSVFLNNVDPIKLIMSAFVFDDNEITLWAEIDDEWRDILQNLNK